MDDAESSHPAKKKRKQDDEIPHELTMVSWNIDGIDEQNRSTRMNAALVVIARINPEVIFLQEMVDEMMGPMKALLEPMYRVISSRPEGSRQKDLPYYCVTLVSRNIEVLAAEIIPFDNTQMTRSMIVVTGVWQKLKIKLVNSHLESMKDYSSQRKVQFKECLQKLQEMMSEDDPSETLAIFGGDLNVRDNEVEDVPEKLRDAWVAGGSREDRRFTWDKRRNDNHPESGNYARLRFDRVYFAGPYKEVEFSIHGLQRIARLGRFPSDHFAVCCRFYDRIEKEKADETS